MVEKNRMHPQSNVKDQMNYTGNYMENKIEAFSQINWNIWKGLEMETLS